MKKEWVAQSGNHLTYSVEKDDGSYTFLPITWKNAEDFLADINEATRIAYGTNWSIVDEYGEKFFTAWLDVLKAKMRRE